MESADKPGWHARQLFSIDHLLAAILIAQIAWFVTQKSGWLGTDFPKGSTELIAIGISILAMLLVAALKALNLTGTKVTRAGLVAIQSAMPGCNIEY